MRPHARTWACLPAALLVVGCNFDTGGGAGSGPDDDAAPIDAATLDAPPGDAAGEPVACTVGGDPCPLTCAEVGGLDGTFCTAPGNIPPDLAVACDSTAASLAPTAGDVTIEADGASARITCDVACDLLDNTAIPAAGVIERDDPLPDLVWFCLADVNIPGTVTVTIDPAVGMAVALLVDGDVAIAGDITLGGGDAAKQTGGTAGAGGGVGADQSVENGQAGGGLCGGSGGAHVGEDGNHGAGGGGGGGLGALGGAGGSGLSPDTTFTGGGGASGAICGDADLDPLLGGGGGGGGADGSCDADCGWPGGGGGGALQISSRTMIQVSGQIQASGGDGFGEDADMLGNGGGGGGGAGGAILLEAPTVDVTSVLRVDGGAGGMSFAGAGGAGASGGTAAGEPGQNGVTAGHGGTGGGGGSGRVRLNGAADCDGASSPAAACTAGPLRLQLEF